MNVTHCACSDVSLTEVIRLQRTGMSFNDIRRTTGVCSACRMCEPYVRVAMSTGRDCLPVLTASQVRQVLRHPEVPPPELASDVC